MIGLRRALLAIAVAGLVVEAFVAFLVATSDHEPDKAATLAFGSLIGLGFIGTGLFAWWRRPENRVGPLMTAVGFAWYISALAEANNAVLFSIGLALNAIAYGFIVHMLLAFPSGRLRGPGERAIVVLTWVTVLVIPLGQVLFTENFHMTGSQPNDIFLIEQSQSTADAVTGVGHAMAVGLASALAVLLIGRWQRGTRAQRRAYAPVFVTGAVLAVGLVIQAGAGLAGAPRHVQDSLWLISLIAFGFMPFAFLVGLGRTRYFRAGALSRMVAGLHERAGIRESLAAALGDPTLRVLYRREGREEFVTAEGEPVAVPDGARYVERGGEVLAALVHDPALAEEPELLDAACTAAAVAIENERLDAELRARVAELQRARERYLRAGLEERRRLERDLHDGAQQRLVALSLQLGLAQSRISTDPDAARELLAAARGELTQALEDLRELARGIHPAILTDRGLDAALEALADRAPVHVALDATPPERLPGAVEAAAYFVVAESLTNVAKYARAAEAHVRVTRRNGTAIVEVSDDGIGGADAARGSGLKGLADRLAVLDGVLEISSPPGEGTTVRATIPCASS